MQRMVNMSSMRMPQLGQVSYPGNYFIQPMPQAQRWITPAQMGITRPSPRWTQPQARQQAPGQAPYTMQPQYRPQRGATPGVSATSSQTGIRPMARAMQGQATPGVPPAPRVANGQPMATPRGPVPAGGTPAYKYTPTMRATAPGIPGQAVLVQGQEPLSASVLAAAHPNDQKQMLGERLFPLIQEKHSSVAGKVTGMLLEMDNAEILHLLEDRELLSSRIDEAVAVLTMHQKTPQNAN